MNNANKELSKKLLDRVISQIHYGAKSFLLVDFPNEVIENLKNGLADDSAIWPSNAIQSLSAENLNKPFLPSTKVLFVSLSGPDDRTGTNCIIGLLNEQDNRGLTALFTVTVSGSSKFDLNFQSKHQRTLTAAGF